MPPEFEGNVAIGMVGAIAVILAISAERFSNYLRNKKANRFHDEHLWGFKLSVIIVLCCVMIVLLLGVAGTTLVMSKRQRRLESLIRCIENRSR